MKKFLPIDTIIEEVIDWGQYRGMLDRVAMKKWANTILRKLETPSEHVDKIVLLDVKDYKAILPEDMEAVVQIAFRDETPRKIRRTEIVEWTQKMYDGSGCELVISKDCPACHNANDDCTCDSPEVVYNVDRLWELSHPEFKYNHMKHYYRHGGLTNDNRMLYSSYHPEFVLMKNATHNFFNADSHIPGCLNLNSKLMANTNLEYRLNYPIVEVNKKEGKILLAYLAVRLDKNGYRYIPDDEYVIEAIKWYIIEALMNRAVGKATTLADKNHYKSERADARNEKLRAMGAAHEILNTPDFMSWWSFLEQNHFKVLKDLNEVNYYDVKTPDQHGLMMNRLTNHR